MDDLISRQAAIDAFGLSEKTRKYGGDHSGYDTRMLYEIQDVLEGLPSVEPKIIRCDECKWNRTENRKETKQWLPCRAIVTPDDFSCIYAEGKANG